MLPPSKADSKLFVTPLFSPNKPVPTVKAPCACWVAVADTLMLPAGVNSGMNCVGMGEVSVTRTALAPLMLPGNRERCCTPFAASV